jgi:phosphoribosylanthranilate isomerase
VKVDCIFGDDYSPKEIITISEVNNFTHILELVTQVLMKLVQLHSQLTLTWQLLQGLDRPIVLSISPGTQVSPALAQNISEHVNMYRITGDDWDSWNDVSSHFSVSR